MKHRNADTQKEIHNVYSYTENDFKNVLTSERSGFYEHITLLGCPIAPSSYYEEVFRGSVLKVKSSLGFLWHFDDFQLEITLLRSCLTLLKISYALCTCPLSHIHHAVEEFDYNYHAKCPVNHHGSKHSSLVVKVVSTFALPYCMSLLHLCCLLCSVTAACGKDARPPTPDLVSHLHFISGISGCSCWSPRVGKPGWGWCAITLVSPLPPLIVS